MRKVKFILLHCLVLLVTIILNVISYFTTNNVISDYNLRIQSWVTIITVLFLFILTIKYTRKIVSAPLLFLGVMFVFFCGQSVIFAFGAEYKKFNLFEIYNNIQLSKALWFSLYFMIIFQIGLFIIYKNRRNLTFDNILVTNSLINASKITAWSMLLISFPVYLFDLSDKLYNSYKYGYVSIYGSNSNSFLVNFLSSFELFLIPSIFILICLYKQNKKITIFFDFIVFLFIIMNFLIGTRGEAIILFLAYVFNKSENLKMIKNKTLFKIGLILLVVLLSIPVISGFRDATTKSVDLFFQSFYTSLILNNPLVLIFGELGGTMRVLIDVMELIKIDENLVLGESYLAAITSFIPTSLMFGYERITLGDWLQDKLHLDYGPGFTLVAEAFINFANYGLVVPLIIGMIFGGIFSFRVKSQEYNILISPLIAASLYFSLFTIRDQILLFIRYEIYGILLPLIVIYLLENFIRKKKKEF